MKLVKIETEVEVGILHERSYQEIEAGYTLGVDVTGEIWIVYVDLMYGDATSGFNPDDRQKYTPVEWVTP